jgi:hypothetical protein
MKLISNSQNVNTVAVAKAMVIISIIITVLMSLGAVITSFENSSKIDELLTRNESQRKEIAQLYDKIENTQLVTRASLASFVKENEARDAAYESTIGSLKVEVKRLEDQRSLQDSRITRAESGLGSVKTVLEPMTRPWYRKLAFWK